MPAPTRGRPPDPDRRQRTLERATAYVLDHGLDGLSLRPLATALDTSTRMLLYDFGSKDQLVRAILDTARLQNVALVTQSYAVNRSPAEALEAWWNHMTHPDRRAWVRLLLQIRAEVLLGRMDPGILGAWTAPYRRLLHDMAAPESDLRLVTATMIGLLEERQITGSDAEARAAFRRFLTIIRCS